jgi:UDP-N-acetyl-2-amino-2-deoxyglucuronate dehydrogenase
MTKWRNGNGQMKWQMANGQWQMANAWVGILGGGSISGTHARAAAAAGCQIAAVYGENADKIRALASEHQVPMFDDLHSFFEHRPMDLIAIGSPSGLHAEQICQAAEHGLHVLVEKPLDISLAKVDTALAAVSRHGVALGVFFQDRLKPDLVRLKQLVSAGALGRPILATASVKWYRPPEYYATSTWRGTWALDGGGALMNQGIHTIDALLWLLGPIVAVSARTATALHAIEVEDTVVATLEFSGGALATFEATTAAYPGYPRRIEITGTEGTAVIDGDTLATVDVRSDARETRGRVRPVSTESQSSPAVSDTTAHRRIFEDFIAALREHREPACSGDEGRRSVAVVEAIYESARNRGDMVPLRVS